MQKSKRHFRRFFHALVIFLWIALMLLICWFSDQPDTVSSQQSMQIGKLICSILVNGYDALSEVTQNQYVEMIDHFVRKTAHFCEYAVLGILTLESFRVMKIGKLQGFAWLWCIFYAATDEYHQLFIPGRYGMVKDVVLDSLGALTGILLCIWVRERLLKYDTN